MLQSEAIACTCIVLQWQITCIGYDFWVKFNIFKIDNLPLGWCISLVHRSPRHKALKTKGFKIPSGNVCEQYLLYCTIGSGTTKVEPQVSFTCSRIKYIYTHKRCQNCYIHIRRMALQSLKQNLKAVRNVLKWGTCVLCKTRFTEVVDWVLTISTVLFDKQRRYLFKQMLRTKLRLIINDEWFIGFR